jgi:hypothetical protein
MEEIERKKLPELRAKCIKTNPKEGVLWKRFKRGENEKKRGDEQILELVLEEIRING